jgi:NAD(P)-dependent dehydrogenase (short-subunit alcohol dehydrogenase family)
VSERRPHILIVGGTGTFGSRLARLLARRQAYRLTIAARDAGRAGKLLAELAATDPYAGAAFMPIERGTIDAELLRQLRVDVVADCSGPFQGAGSSLVEAAIGARCHYVDLSDSRAFVAGIDRLGLQARAAGVTVITGASTTPALTHAVLDSITKGWMGLDAIDVAIVPGNKTPRGRSVIAAILSWVGHPVRVFEEAEWREARGWSGSGVVTIEGLGKRRAAVAELPDLDLIPGRYKPRIRGQIRAGMELRPLHWLIGIAGLCVRWRLVKSAQAFTGIGTFIATLLSPFGTDAGGMVIEATGRDARGEARVARWSLVARNGDGPYVPVAPAAAIVAGLAAGDGHIAAPGARSAAGVLGLEQIRPWFEGLAIETRLSAYRNEKPLFRIVLGAGYEKMPATTRRLHRGRPAVIADGEAQVAGATNALGAALARAFGFPEPAERVPVRVIIESVEGRERWTRFFDGRPMRSVMQGIDENMIAESFGVVAVTMKLEARPDGLDMLPHSGRIGPVPLPRFLLPRIRAEERVDELGRHRFDVDIGLPLVGRLVAYRGFLRV